MISEEGEPTATPPTAANDWTLTRANERVLAALNDPETALGVANIRSEMAREDGAGSA